jgi:hypothetical protein
VRLDAADPIRVARALLEAPGVSRIETASRHVVAVTSQPEAFFADLPARAEREGLAITAVVPADEDLEAVFRYLIK